MNINETEQIALSEARPHLSSLAQRVAETQERLVLTKNGAPLAVLLSIRDLESLEETLAVMSDGEAMASIREADADRATGVPTTAWNEVMIEARLRFEREGLTSDEDESQKQRGRVGDEAPRGLALGA